MLSLLLIVGCNKDDLRVTNDPSLELELRNGNGVRVTKPFKTTIQVPVTELVKGTFAGFCDEQFGNFHLISPGSDETEFLNPTFPFI